MKQSLKNLADYSKRHNINLILMMMPEVHDLKNYKYQFAHDIMAKTAKTLGYKFVDGLPALQDVKSSQDLWAMPGDPHPNALAHNLFADAVYLFLMNKK